MQRLMQRRTLACWLVAAVIGLSCLSAVDGPTAPSPAAIAPQGQSGTAFRHGSHLSPTWHTTPRAQQFEQHCAVCHSYDANAPVGLGEVQTKCSSCHYSGTTQAQGDPARLVFTGGEANGTARTFAYDHQLNGHRERACVECHAWSPAPRGDFLQADVVFAMPDSMVVCADCHHHGADDPGAKSQATVHKAGGGAAWRATWDRASGCDECHKAGTPQRLDSHRRTMARAFTHASHVPAADLGADAKSSSCRGCHSMDDAAGASGMGVQQKSCGDCHFADQGEATTRLAADAQVERMPTQFTHTSKGHREKDCSTCHPMAAGARDPDVGRMYADCTKTCHQERRVERHGAWSCNDCHQSGDPRAETDEAAQQAIARVAVQRPSDGSKFAFATMRHPGVTNGASAVHAANDGRACRDCHRRELEGLAHAASERPFVHDGHLESLSPQTPSTACTVCHVGVRDTTSAARVVAFAADALREAETCTKQCHQSRRMTVVAATATVEVPVFNHAQHAARQCAECHVAGATVTDLRSAVLGGDAGASFSCARCHGHKDPEKVKITGGYDTTKPTDTCRECHAPKAKPDYHKELRPQQRFQLLGERRQFHAKGGSCATCHGLEQGRPGPARTRIRILEHRELHQAHTGVPGPGGSTRTLPAVDDAKNANCLSCHAWQPGQR